MKIGENSDLQEEYGRIRIIVCGEASEILIDGFPASPLQKGSRSRADTSKRGSRPKPGRSLMGARCALTQPSGRWYRHGHTSVLTEPRARLPRGSRKVKFICAPVTKGLPIRKRGRLFDRPWRNGEPRNEVSERTPPRTLDSIERMTTSFLIAGSLTVARKTELVSFPIHDKLSSPFIGD